MIRPFLEAPSALLVKILFEPSRFLSIAVPLAAIVAVGLDAPFVDPVNPGQLQGQAPPPAGTPPGLPFHAHH
ncbi:hypothetical protein [Archangium violaceum]|uniref:hypothetical protein n=1 Tax=Archangium violaceum TaxID=83451 RepID=UPI00126A30B3|nr:hypothetical protein [Archangium violaceum]